MASGKPEPDLTEVILELLANKPQGMEFNELAERVAESNDIAPRTLRNFLNDLVKSRKLARQKMKSGGQGAPPYVYLHSRFVPDQLTLFDGAQFEIHTKSEIGAEDVDPQEQKRAEESENALLAIAKGHLNQDSLAQAIIDIAPEFANENPLDILLDMANWVVSDINRLGGMLREAYRKNTDLQVLESLADEIVMRLDWAKVYFYNQWHLNQLTESGEIILDLPQKIEDFVIRGSNGRLLVEAARDVLKERISGNKTITVFSFADSLHQSAVGTDASVADIYLEHTPGKFIRPDPVSVMNAAAAKRTREGYNILGDYQDFDIFPDGLKEYTSYTAAKKGLVISPAMKDLLDERDYKHTRMAAMELRQYTEDLRVVLGQARWRPIGELQHLDAIPEKPSIIFRDGRIFPLVHRLKDYEEMNLYGQIVRNQIEQFANVIHHTMSGPGGNIVYGAAVKNPQQHWIAPLVFWYLHTKQRKRGSRLLVQADDVYNVPFTDTAVSHLLFLGLATTRKTQLGENELFVTFRSKRRFSDVAFVGEDEPALQSAGGLHYPLNENDPTDWLKFIEQRINERLRKRSRKAGLDKKDYSNFIYLCAKVGVAMCYVAPLKAYRDLISPDYSGNHFLLPRLEVAIAFNEPLQEQESLNGMLSWLASNGFELDNAHTQSGFDNDITDSGMPILVPDVIVSVHEAVTFARDHMSEEVEDELRALIAELRKKQL